MTLKIIKTSASPYWQIRGSVSGLRIRESTGTADKKLAEEMRAKQEAELFRAAIYGTKVHTVTWEQACLSYVEQNPPSGGTKVFLLKLTTYFGRTRLAQIDQAAVDNAGKMLCRPDAAPATRLRNVVTPVKAVLMHASRRGWCDPPNFERMSGGSGNKRTRWLTPDEFTRLHEAAPPHLKILVLFLVCTGARLGEALGLEWEDVDLTHARATLRDTKNGNDRILELEPAILAALTTSADLSGRVFRTHRGHAYPDSTFGGGQIKTAWDSLRSRAKLSDDVTPHILRHTWASWRYAFHKDLLRLKQEGDWSSVVLCERYAKLTPPGMVPEILKVWGISSSS